MAADDEDAWLEQLREALASTSEEEPDRRPAFTLASPAETPALRPEPNPCEVGSIDGGPSISSQPDPRQLIDGAVAESPGGLLFGR